MTVMPMFPLGSVLMPAMPLPLRIFEPRYLKLLGDLLGSENPEFGVVLMIGGNIPGQTRVASVQIYDYVEAMQYSQAHSLSAILLLFSFLVLLALQMWRPQTKREV
jgi:molybdate transport system permease protein